MYDDCNLIQIAEPELVIEFISSEVALVEIEKESNIIEIIDCKNEEINFTSDPIVAEIVHEENIILEVMHPEIVIEFPESINIVNEYDGVPVDEDYEQVVCFLEAGEVVQVNRIVCMMSDGRIKHADKDNPEDAKDAIGMSTTSGAVGSQVKVVKFGVIQGAAIGAISENFFLGNNGQLVSVPPTTGTWLEVGMQLQASTFLVDIGEPIRRN